MCGICGIVKARPDELGSLVLRMTRAQEHRGPDGRGYFVDGVGAPFSDEQSPGLQHPSVCCLGHSRLAIIDPRGGFQPMTDESKGTVALFNGEIY
ncbi:MAG: asparagine synthase (glutamine-hydrolyzing), partial [Lentisphaerae bacterium]|nr:asparagine synthase (glutamine-hydrolyzing) [Lentisphaerota bacterium]